MKYYLAVDIGASSGRHVLGYIEDGVIKTQEIYRFKNGFFEENGHKKWDTEYLLKEIINGLKKAKELGKIPQSVGVDTWGVDYALLDKEDKLIDGVYAYRDSRTDKTVPAVHQKVPFAELYKRTGIAQASYNTVYQLYDDLITGRMKKAKTFLMLPDYLHFLLTGVKKQEYSNATTTGLVNAKTKTWDFGTIAELGYKQSLFQTLYTAGDRVGKIKKEIADEIGYETQVILPPTHDTASAILGAPIDTETLFLSSGTWSILGVETDEIYTDENALKSGYSGEGGYGKKTTLLTNIMGLWIIQQIRKETGDKYSFAELSKLAEENPVDKVICVNDKAFLAPENMTETVWKNAGGKMSLGETAYCVFNSLAVDYKRAVKDLEKTTGKRYNTLRIIGGGSQNNLLNALTKKHTGLRVTAGPTECTAIGNLLAQMIATGEVANEREGRKMIEKSFEITEV